MVRAKAPLLTLAASIILLALGSVAHAVKPQPITQCDDPIAGFLNITQSGTYVLENDIVSTGPICIEIDGIDRVKLQMNGYKISGATNNEVSGIKLQNSSRISIIGPGTLYGNEFGILDFGLSSTVTISKLLIINNNSVGILLASIIGQSSNFLIEHNIIIDNNNHGIQLDTQINDVRIIENEIIGNFGEGILLNPGENRTVRGNNVSLNSRGGINVNGLNISVEVVDNIVLNPGKTDIRDGGNDTGIFSNNICEISTILVDCPQAKLPNFDIDHF